MEHDRVWQPCSSSIFLVNSHLHHSYKRPKFHCLGCKNYTSTWSSSSSFFVVFTNIKYFTYKSRGLGQAKPEPSREWRLRPGLRFDEAKAGSSQAKAMAFRPSRAVHSTTGKRCSVCLKTMKKVDHKGKKKEHHDNGKLTSNLEDKTAYITCQMWHELHAALAVLRY